MRLQALRAFGNDLQAARHFYESMFASRGCRLARAKGRLTRLDDGQGDGIAAHTATRGLFAGTRVRHVAVRSVEMRAAFRLGPQ
jgi:hypothetical protein